MDTSCISPSTEQIRQPRSTWTHRTLTVLLKQLPFKAPERPGALYEDTSEQFSYNAVAGDMFAEWKKQIRSFSDLALIGDAVFNLSGDEGQLPEKVHGSDCT